MRGRTDLAVLCEGDPRLLNKYSVIELDPRRHPQVNVEGAKALTDFLLSPGARAILRTFGVKEHGQPLFVPEEAP